MDRPNGQIEVELLSNDGTPAPGLGGPAAPPSSEADTVDVRRPRVFDGERGRLVLVGAAAATVAMVIGWAIGRATAPEAAIAPVVVTTLAATEPDPAGETLPAPEPEGDAPVTTRSRPIVAAPRPTAPAAAAGEVAVSFVDVDGRLADAGVEVVMRAAGRRLLTLDVGTGELTDLDVERQPFGPPAIAAGDDWVLLPAFDESLEATLVFSDGSVGSADLGVAWGLLPIPGTDEFWRSDDALTFGRRGSIERVRYDGSRLGTTIDVPTVPLLADPAGGVVVDVEGGGTYRVTPDGAMKLTDGDVLAVSATHLVVHECDERLRCGYHRVDRESGGRVGIPLTDELGADAFLRTPWQPLAGSSLSPDGGALIVVFLDRSDETSVRDVLGVLDLGTGAFSELADNLSSNNVAWSPDGGNVFFVDGGRLFAFDRFAGEIFEVTPDVLGVEAFALRGR